MNERRMLIQPSGSLTDILQMLSRAAISSFTLTALVGDSCVDWCSIIKALLHYKGIFESWYTRLLQARRFIF